jgi:hemerythrin superfamily protein
VDITRLLEADHRQVEDLFSKIPKAEGDARQPLVDQLSTALRKHMELEEQVLYPAMKGVTGEEAVEEANTEHELGRKILADVEALAPDEPGFGAALEACRAGIDHHVQEEEHEVFPKLRKQGRVLEQVATPFMQQRSALGLPTTADALGAASSKEELLAEARSADIEGASTMTKPQLAEALAAKLS